MNVVVNGLMTNYQKVGKGPVVVCLPGWGDTTTSFSKLAEELQDKFTVLSLDLPGFGGTQAPYKAWGIDDYAHFVDAWLKKINIKKVNGLVGHSYGGAIAISLVGNGQMRPDGLILLASSGIRDIYRLRRLVLKGGAKIAKIPLKILPSHTQSRLKRKAYKSIGSDAMLLPHMEATYRRLIGQDMQQTAAQVKIPTLLVYGSNDKSTPAKYGKLFNEAITSSRLEIIPGAGHFLHQEQTKEVSSLILEFLES